MNSKGWHKVAGQTLWVNFTRPWASPPLSPHLLASKEEAWPKGQTLGKGLYVVQLAQGTGPGLQSKSVCVRACMCTLFPQTNWLLFKIENLTPGGP